MMKKSFIQFVVLILSLFTINTYCIAQLQVSTNFESGSAKVLSLNSETQTIRIVPAGDPKKGTPNWWYLRIDGIDVQKTLVLEVEASDAPVTAELTGKSQKISPAWTWPARAAISFDGEIWKQTDEGYKMENYMAYCVKSSYSTIWIAWGPPFTPTDAQDFVQKIDSTYTFVQSFTLCKSRDGRTIPLLHIMEGNKPAAQRPAVWVHARQHAWECGGSWVAVGFTEWLVSSNLNAQWLRQNADVYIVPIMDVDHVATGDGGKLALPQDQNLDWSDNPYWPEVAAAQKRILALAKEGRMSVFLDLHNPSPGNKQQTAYVIEKAYMPEKAEPRKLRFVELMINEYGVLKQNPASPPAENPEIFHRVSVPWVLEHSNPATIAFCIETPWNIPAGTPQGYKLVGEKLGSAVQRLLQEEVKNP